MPLRQTDDLDTTGAAGLQGEYRNQEAGMPGKDSSKLAAAPSIEDLKKEIEQHFPALQGMQFSSAQHKANFQAINAKYPGVGTQLARAYEAMGNGTDSKLFSAEIQADLLIAANKMRAHDNIPLMDVKTFDVDQDILHKAEYRSQRYDSWSPKKAVETKPEGSVPAVETKADVKPELKGDVKINTNVDPKSGVKTDLPTPENIDADKKVDTKTGKKDAKVAVKVGEQNPTVDKSQEQANGDLKGKLEGLNKAEASSNLSPEAKASLDAARQNIKGLIEFDVGYALSTFKPIKEKYGSRIQEINVAAAKASEAAKQYDEAAKAQGGQIQGLNAKVDAANVVMVDGKPLSILDAGHYANAVKSFFKNGANQGRAPLSGTEKELINGYLNDNKDNSVDAHAAGLLKGDALKQQYDAAIAKAQAEYQTAMKAAGTDAAKKQAATSQVQKAFASANDAVKTVFKDLDTKIATATTAMQGAQADLAKYPTVDGKALEDKRIARDQAYADLAKLSGGEPSLVASMKSDIKAMEYDDAVAYKFARGIKLHAPDIEIHRSKAYNEIFSDGKFLHDQLQKRMSLLDPAIQKAFAAERPLTPQEMLALPKEQKTWAEALNRLFADAPIDYIYKGKTNMVLDRESRSFGPAYMRDAHFFTYSRLRIVAAREHGLKNPVDYDTYSDASLFNRDNLKHANTADGRSFGGAYVKQFQDRFNSDKRATGLVDGKDRDAMNKYLSDTKRVGRLTMDQSSRTELQKLFLPENIIGTLALGFTIVNGFQVFTAGRGNNNGSGSGSGDGSGSGSGNGSGSGY